MLFGMLLALGGVAAYALVEWTNVLAAYPHYVRPLRRMMALLLRAAYHWAYGVAALMFVAGVYRFATARGGRVQVAWKLFAYFTLWVIGSLAFFFGLFIAYAPGFGEGGSELLVPGLLGCLGYMVIGVGFVASLLHRPAEQLVSETK